MGGERDGGGDYSLTEIFAIKFVLADVLIIAALVLAGPLYALAIVAIFVFTTFLIWYLSHRAGSESAGSTAETESATVGESERDPVTKLQERYAAGELSESEFEAKLERLIESNEQAEAAGIDTEELELERSD